VLSLSSWPNPAKQQLRGVFTDVDDTLTTGGVITSDALAALEALQAAGLAVIAVTGRSVGWVEAMAADWSSSWPLDAIVAENGAVLLQHQIGLRPNESLPQLLSKTYQTDAATRQRNFTQLQRAAQRILREVPGSALAADSAGRETDIAIDHSEFAHLSAEHIAQVVALMRAEGLHASVSSIHINGWLGEHSKLTGARWAVKACFGRELNAELGQWAFVGDSSNDALMFAAFENSIGVANVRRFEAQLAHMHSLPRYVTQAERGAGFAQVAQALLGG
jgi:HAD superfamily hydrolase (TIGR01484 family)